MAAAMPPFMSALPRPYSRPSSTWGSKGSRLQAAAVTGTTSRCPLMIRVGRSPGPPGGGGRRPATGDPGRARPRSTPDASDPERRAPRPRWVARCRGDCGYRRPPAPRSDPPPRRRRHGHAPPGAYGAARQAWAADRVARPGPLPARSPPIEPEPFRLEPGGRAGAATAGRRMACQPTVPRHTGPACPRVRPAWRRRLEVGGTPVSCSRRPGRATGRRSAGCSRWSSGAGSRPGRSAG